MDRQIADFHPLGHTVSHPDGNTPHPACTPHHSACFPSCLVNPSIPPLTQPGNSFSLAGRVNPLRGGGPTSSWGGLVDPRRDTCTEAGSRIAQGTIHISESHLGPTGAEWGCGSRGNAAHFNHFLRGSAAPNLCPPQAAGEDLGAASSSSPRVSVGLTGARKGATASRAPLLLGSH